MDEFLTVLKEYWLLILTGICGLFAIFRKAVEGVEWAFKTFGIETKSMRQKREWSQRLSDVEKAIKAIKETSKHNVDMFLEHEKQIVDRFAGIENNIIGKLNDLNDTLVEQKKEMDETNKANIKTDRAMLRDRIAGGMRYFSQNKGEDSKVHIGLSDYENMEALFQQYFAKGGNGTFKKMYEDEFQHFEIDQ